MKTLRQLFAVIVLTLMLALATPAGTIHTTVAPPEPAPTPAPAQGDMSMTVNGTIHTGHSDEATAGDAVAAGALALVQSVLSLL